MNITDFLKTYQIDRRQTDSVKWDGMKQAFGRADLLPLWIADTDFKVPAAVVAALQKVIAQGAYGYSMTPENYFAAYANWQQNHYGTEIHPEWLRYGTGVVQSLSTLINVLTQPQAAIMVLQPVYFPFMKVIEENDRQLVVSELKPVDHHYEMDFADIEQKIVANQVHLLINCSPHNPVGRVWSEAELERLLEICREHEVLLISDEIHHDLIVGPQRFISALSVKNGFYRDNLVMLDAASKTFNLAGLKSSHVVIPNPQMRARYDAYFARLAAPAGTYLGQVAALAAYQAGQDWLDGFLAVVRQNFAILKQLEKVQPQVKVYDLQGTYLAWVDLRRVIDPAKLKQVMLTDAKLAVNLGEMFGQSGRGFVRLNLATPPQNIKAAVARLQKVIENK
ncbi:MalY/PatB family protein [Liquorilactobacillus vini]|uniref:cysteine-S-conjugate beta-lyase n=1 Tax=Liquorilactobacillus vini DSM 20605 TaxID=1133569 RepID=A0A0R2C5S4_9LACO|nr:MalY/PatB family protein [Liquorilactobacillus vini]KRM83091.1 aminotransferase [Liquorilactobacillus vini DSM 20605]